MDVQKPATFLFTDIVGSTALWEKYPKRMSKWLHTHFQIVTRLVKEYYPNAMVVKTIGDANMLAFFSGTVEPSDSLIDAVHFAIRLQKIQRRAEGEIKLRIGIAYGPFFRETQCIQHHKLSDFFGPTINAASRMESKVSLPDGFAFVCLSDPGNRVMAHVARIIEKMSVVAHWYARVCPTKQPALVRSGRLLSMRHYPFECHDPALLRGVNDIIAYAVQVLSPTLRPSRPRIPIHTVKT